MLPSRHPSGGFRASLFSAALLLVAWGYRPALAAPIIDNLNPDTGNGYVFNGSLQWASGFRLSPTTSATVERVVVSGIFSDSSQVRADILADNGGLPGALLISLIQQPPPDGRHLAFAPASLAPLPAGQDYWLKLDIAGTATGNLVRNPPQFSGSNPVLAPGVAYVGLLHSPSDGATWLSFGPGDALSFSITGTVPEPGSAAILIACGLTLGLRRRS